MAKKKKSYEEAAQRLEEIVEILENNNISLDESIKLYKEGMELSLICRERLDTAQKEVMELRKTFEDKFYLNPFDGYEEEDE